MRVGWKPKFDNPRVASVRFRCLTPMSHLRAVGFPIELFDEGRLGDYDVVIFEKRYGPEDQALAKRLRARGCRTILDLSDNHFYNPRNLPDYVRAARDQRRMARQVDQIVCCSAYLAEVVRRELAPKRAPLVVGDAVEEFELPARMAGPGAPFAILWFGSHGSPNAPAGMEDLRRIRDQLAHAADVHGAELVVVSNKQETFERLRRDLPCPARYREWDTAVFAEELARADLIVVPVNPNPFTLCKSNNRVATALWHGVPVLGDRIPAYDALVDFAVIDDWDGGFRLALNRDPSLARRTQAGQAYVRAHFNGPAIARDWRAAIEATLARAGAADALP